MNIKVKSIVSMLALSAMVFAAEPEIPAAEPALPTATADSSAAAPAAPAAENPAAEIPAAASAETAPAAETPAAAPVAESVPAAPAESENEFAPAAVRDGAAPTPAPAVAAPAPQTQDVYRPVATAEPTAVRQSEAPAVKTIYVAQVAAPDTMSFDELRGLVPIGPTFGVQGFIGSYTLTGDDWDDDDTYSGISWRAGLFGIFPLNDYSMGLKVAVLYEQSKASESFQYVDKSEKIGSEHIKFKQSKIDVPVLFMFKAPRSGISFDIGAQVSVPVKDEMKLNYEDSSGKGSYKMDMIDKDYRSDIDWSLVFGFAIRANKYVGLDLRFDCGFSEMYDSVSSLSLNDLTSAAFLIGLSFYVF